LVFAFVAAGPGEPDEVFRVEDDGPAGGEGLGVCDTPRCDHDPEVFAWFVEAFEVRVDAGGVGG
jgi:hypothetical protein